MFDDFRSKSLDQVSRVVIGTLLTLATASFAGAYLARREMETTSLEHSQRLHEASQQLVFLRSLLDESSAAVNHSRDRLMQAGFLRFPRNLSAVDGATADRWHNQASLEGQDAAANDLASLTKFSYGSSGSSQVAQILLRPVEEMLRAEIEVWRKVDGFAEWKGARGIDEEALHSVGHALREYRELDKSYANALSKASGEFSRKEMEENAEMKQFVEEALGRSRTKLKWSGLGLAAASLGLPCYALYLCWPRLQSKPPDKTIIVADRTGSSSFRV